MNCSKYNIITFAWLFSNYYSGSNNDFDCTNNSGILEKCLCSSAKYNIIENIRLLVEYGVDIHIQDDFPFRAAAYYGCIDVMNYLIEKGANIHAKNDYALNYCIKYGIDDGIEILKAKGSKPRPITFDEAPEGFNPRYNTHCPISLEKIDYDSERKYLVCGKCRNVFDYDSLYEWLSEHESCPSCRTQNSYSRKKKGVYVFMKN